MFYDDLSNYPKALEYYQKSLHVYEELNDKVGLSKCYNNIGILYVYQEDYDKALEYFEKTLRIDESLKDTVGISMGMNNIGIIYQEKGDLDMALKYFRNSKELSDATGNIGLVAACYGNISIIEHTKGNYSESLNYCSKSLELFLKTGDMYSIAMTYLCIADNNIAQSNYSNALYYIDKSFELAEKYNYISLKRTIHKKFSEVYAATNDYENAYENYILFKELNDSIFNEDNIKKLTQLESQYEFEKEKQALQLVQQKKNALHEEEAKRQKTIRNFFLIGLLLMFLFLGFLLYFLSKIRIANRILENQKEELNSALTTLKDTQNKLVRYERMASVGVLTAGIAHEINNPLNFIQGGVLSVEDILKESVTIETNNKITPFLDVIRTGIKRISNIVHSLGRFSRGNDLEIENCNLHSIFENCLVMLNNRIHDRIEIVRNYADTDILIRGNEGRLHQAFMNILINAIQSIESKGTIKIDTILEHDRIKIQISDTGKGIEKDNLKKITDPFFYDKRSRRRNRPGFINNLHNN
jgi:signal transduction histidine kinase